MSIREMYNREGNSAFQILHSVCLWVKNRLQEKHLSVPLCQEVSAYETKSGRLLWAQILGFLWNRAVPLDFPGGSDDKNSACNAGYLGSIPGSGRSPGKGNGNSLQYSCLENLMDKGAMAGFKRIRQDCATKRQQQNTCVSITRKEIKVMNNVGDFNKILNQRKNKLD